MKILFIITRGDSIGGAQTHLATLADAFRNNGHEILVCFGGNTNGPFHQLLKEACIPFRNVTSLKREVRILDDFRAIRQINRVIDSFTPDIISLHSSKAGMLGRICGYLKKIPVVFTVHGWAFTEGVNRYKASIYKRIERSFASLAAKIIVVSNFDKEIALKNKISSADKFVVVHNGIRLNDLVISSNISQITKIVMVARFDEQKDHETAIKATLNISDIEVHFVGDGMLLEDMKKLVNSLHVGEKYFFHGYKNNVYDFLKAADIFLLISNWEGFPISTLEAMNFNLPVVVSNVGGANEAVIDDVTGFLVERKDVDKLKEVLEHLVRNVQMRRKMGENGKKFLKNNFSVESMFEKTLAVYNDVIIK